MSFAQRLQAAWLRRSALSIALLPVAALLAAADTVRRILYRVGWLPTQRLEVPVVVVGNLIVGGAGKTPTVLALLAWLRARGHRPGVISRGHGRDDAEVIEVTPDTPAKVAGDEPLLIRLRGGVPVVVGRDRAAAGRALLAAHPSVDILVSDDGLQHLRLARDTQLIVFDERGAGNGWRLPAGPLREPVPAQVPARSLVLYNAAAPTTALPGHLVNRHLRGVVPLAGWWRGDPATHETLDRLRGRPLLAAAGIAQPERFFAMLEGLGLSIERLPLPDHHEFAALPWPPATREVIVTEKDAVKLRPDAVGTASVWVATLDFTFDTHCDAALAELIPAPH